MSARILETTALATVALAATVRSAVPRDPPPAEPDPAGIVLATAGHPAVGGLVAWAGAVRILATADEPPEPDDVEALRRWVRTATALDPDLLVAAELGSVALARWGATDDALAVLEEAARRRPDATAILVLRGLGALAWRHDRTDAAAWLERTGDPGLTRLARSLAAEAP